MFSGGSSHAVADSEVGKLSLKISPASSSTSLVSSSLLIAPPSLDDSAKMSFTDYKKKEKIRI